MFAKLSAQILAIYKRNVVSLFCHFELFFWTFHLKFLLFLGSKCFFSHFVAQFILKGEFSNLQLLLYPSTSYLGSVRIFFRYNHLKVPRAFMYVHWASPLIKSVINRFKIERKKEKIECSRNVGSPFAICCCPEELFLEKLYLMFQ